MSAPRPAPSSVQLDRAESGQVIQQHVAASIRTARQFFDAHAEDIARACARLAPRCERGGTLFVFGEGPQTSDAQHVAVEFVHPVIVGKRALPAIALSADGNDLSVLGTPQDIALALCAAAPSEAVLAALRQARRQGLLTVLLAGDAATSSQADIAFAVPGANPLVVQEVHETLYHVLWELVHVFFEDRLTMQELCPFLFGGGPAADDHAAVLREVSASTRLKCEDTCGLRTRVFERWSGEIAEIASAIAVRVARGGRLLAFGNGGSATDAQDVALDCLAPPLATWRQIPALALPNDIGVVTGVANDVGFEHVFSRQILAFGRPDDIALGISTSGTSRNVIAALDTSKQRGLLTLGLAGYDGGAMAGSSSIDHCVVVEGDYIPRIQEAHATIWHALLSAVQAELSAAHHGDLS